MMDVTDSTPSAVTVLSREPQPSQVPSPHLSIAQPLDIPEAFSSLQGEAVSGSYLEAPPLTTVHLRLLSTVTHSLAHAFVAFLPEDPRIERVFCSPDKDFLRVWTVIQEPDLSLEEPIYNAQLRFMDKFPEFPCDFLVIYRFGKSVEEVAPQSSTRIF